ncbi:hypothetical protein G6O67_000449 [Ophiocordyceps sinensis]|uniref:Uncharacterized protein n=1 Tax=Ophiocordyceps sinensis TaxID=72228 RepID=A0A8H4V9R6_9HYPO|nr:hypothetical protein G6O67_000449 [Ophiocordyceps sinensis]
MRQWFIVDEKHQVTLVDKFYHSGEGLGQHTTTRSLSLPRSGRQPLALHRLAISLTRPKPDAVGQKLTTATRYIWKFPRPKDDKHTRLVLFAAYQATIRVSKDATKIFVRLIPRELRGQRLFLCVCYRRHLARTTPSTIYAMSMVVKIKARAAAAAKKLPAILYIWKFPRPHDDRHARLVLFAAHEATMRTTSIKSLSSTNSTIPERASATIFYFARNPTSFAAPFSWTISA